mgnify:CR=1 FL=1
MNIKKGEFDYAKSVLNEKSNNLNNVKLAINHENKVLYLSRSKIPSDFKRDFMVLKQCGVSVYKYSFNLKIMVA